MRLEKACAKVSMAETSMEANLPYFHSFQSVSHSLRMSQTVCSSSRSRSVCAVSLLAGGSMEKISRPCFMARSRSRSACACAWNSLICSVAFATGISWEKGPWRWKSARRAWVAAVKSLRFWRRLSRKSPLAFSRRRSASLSVCLCVARSAPRAVSFAISSSLTATSNFSRSLYCAWRGSKRISFFSTSACSCLSMLSWSASWSRLFGRFLKVALTLFMCE
mmetsp:Transcript_17841/g.51918  ORF Transcript_17841/g.51918 Transcript_17841/m.51918 type:complete len:221 (-) Transcript_17841:1576-2238(-)